MAVWPYHPLVVVQCAVVDEQGLDGAGVARVGCATVSTVCLDGVLDPVPVDSASDVLAEARRPSFVEIIFSSSKTIGVRQTYSMSCDVVTVPQHSMIRTVEG